MSRILLLEPANNLSKVIVRAFEQAGIETDRASTSQQAVSLADAHKPDAVILELALPKHNGVEFLYEFRSHGDWNSVPIIFYSQVSAEECGLSQEQQRVLGIAGHYYKPTTSLQTLRIAVQDLLAP